MNREPAKTLEEANRRIQMLLKWIDHKQNRIDLLTTGYNTISKAWGTSELAVIDLEEENQQLKVMLKRIQFEGFKTFYGAEFEPELYICPICKQDESMGHKLDCELYALIKEKE